MTNEDLREELEHLSPTLARLKDEQEGFCLPPGYFQQMQEAVMNRLQSEKEQDPAPRPVGGSWLDRLAEQVMVLLQPRYAVALAAVLVIIVGGWLLLNSRLTNGGGPCADLACLTTEELNAYIFSNPEDFDLHTILEAGVNTDALDNLGLPIENLEEADVQEYLENHLPNLDAAELENLF